MSVLLTLDKKGSQRPARNSRGQPTRYDAALGEAICRDIAAGVPVYKAFCCNGISVRTGFNWTRRLPDFSRAVAAARAQYQRRARDAASLAG